MSEQSEGGTLNVGVVCLERKRLFSLVAEKPQLFSDSLNEHSNYNIETQAASLVSFCTSSLYMLIPARQGLHQGYLLRETTPIDPTEHGLTVFSAEQIEAYTSNQDPQDMSRYFLRQILRHMQR